MTSKRLVAVGKVVKGGAIAIQTEEEVLGEIRKEQSGEDHCQKPPKPLQKPLEASKTL